MYSVSFAIRRRLAVRAFQNRSFVRISLDQSNATTLTAGFAAAAGFPGRGRATAEQGDGRHRQRGGWLLSISLPSKTVDCLFMAVYLGRFNEIVSISYTYSAIHCFCRAVVQDCSVCARSSRIWTGWGFPTWKSSKVLSVTVVLV